MNTSVARSAKFSHPPTEEQVAVRDAIASGGSVMVTAYAGCSKSTTLEFSAPSVRVPALGLAFNKKIAQDLGPRMPGNFTVKTINALGHGVWARACAARGVTNVRLDDRKIGKLCSEVAKDYKIELSSDQWDGLRRLVSAAMQAGVVPKDQGRPLARDSVETWEDLAMDKLWFTQEDFELLLDPARTVLERNLALALEGTISFDDQIWASTCVGGTFPQYPVVFVDEAQDLSPLNHAMLALCLRQDARLVAVGDPKQAIYAFRGADHESMERIRGLRRGESWQDRRLSMTFRCPKVVVERQALHAPGFRAWHTNADGRAVRLGDEPEVFGDPRVWTWGQVEALRPHAVASLAVLCRNNAPLLKLAFRLLRQGIGPTMLGRDLGKGLVTLAKKLAPEGSTTRAQVESAITAWEESETSATMANGHSERVAGITDRAECLRAVLAGASCRTAQDLWDMLARLFARETGTVTLGSIHKAKGLEFDVVLHLDPWRIPSKQARRAAAEGDQRALVQEMNLGYVVETRTRHTLVLADLEGLALDGGETG